MHNSRSGVKKNCEQFLKISHCINCTGDQFDFKSFAEYLTKIEFLALSNQVAYKKMCIAQMLSVHYDSSFQY